MSWIELRKHINPYPPVIPPPCSRSGKNKGGGNNWDLLDPKNFPPAAGRKNLIFERFRQTYDLDFSCVIFFLKNWLQKRRRRKIFGDLPSKNKFLLPENTFLKGFQYVKRYQIAKIFRPAAGSGLFPPLFQIREKQGGGGVIIAFSRPHFFRLRQAWSCPPPHSRKKNTALDASQFWGRKSNTIFWWSLVFLIYKTANKTATRLHTNLKTCFTPTLSE